MCAKLQGKGTDPHGPTYRIGWEKRKWGDAGGGTLGTTYARAQLFQETMDMYWGGSYSSPHGQGSDIALGTPRMVLGIPKSGL